MNNVIQQKDTTYQIAPQTAIVTVRQNFVEDYNERKG
jgi:hypothetical protein